MNILKRLRAEAGLSLRDLEKASGVDQSTISMIENEHRKAQLPTLGKLAKALNVPLDDFMELVDTGAAERGRKGGLTSTKKENQAA